MDGAAAPEPAVPDDERTLSLGERYALGRLPPTEQRWIERKIAEDPLYYGSRWWWLARREQYPPLGDWRTWLVMAGRGFGKTRTGAEFVRMAAAAGGARIAIVGATLHEARAVMVEGESGVRGAGADYDRPRFEPARRRLVWDNGSEARLYSADDPDSLRGGQHTHAWGDEVAKWPHGPEAWANLRMGLRLGDCPQALLTTTPRPVALVKALWADAANVARSVGRTSDNARHLAPGFAAELAAAYGGTRLGRQELDGELVEDVEGALWTRAVIEGCRLMGAVMPSPSPRRGEGRERERAVFSCGAAPLSQPSPARGEGFLVRVVVAVDPPASATGDACGIVAVGLGADGLGYVIGDMTVEKAAPEAWAAAVAGAVEAVGADCVVAEANNGGDMVASVLGAAGLALPVKLVRASRGKAARAEPVAALYACGRVKHVGALAALEDQLCGLLPGGGYEGPGRSPDRADALVWAVTELMLGEKPRRPGVRVL